MGMVINKQAGTVTFTDINFGQGVETINAKGKVNTQIGESYGNNFGMSEQGEYKVKFCLMVNNNKSSNKPKGKVVKL